MLTRAHRIAFAAVLLVALVAAAPAQARRPPDPAAAVSATLAPGGVDVNWAASRDGHVVAYRIYRAPSDTLVFTAVGEIDSTQFFDAPGTGTWTYLVVSVDEDGQESAPTEQFTIDVPRGLPPAPV